MCASADNVTRAFVARCTRTTGVLLLLVSSSIPLLLSQVMNVLLA
jgi:hypothetical protein